MRIAVSVVVLVALTAAARASISPVSDFGSNPGALDMFEYVPAGLPAGRPLVVVLHGCTQNAAAMEAAGWNALADAHGFAVLYPQQRAANQQLSCFTWYGADDISRDTGEAASIVAMVDNEIAIHGVDRNAVYVTGLSAGAAMTAVLLAAYPDRFRGGSIMAGIPYKCASDVSSGSTCASSGMTKTPAQWGDLVRGADPGFSGTRPRVQIWQGTKDYTVAPANATELVKQWTDVWAIDQTADTTETISTATRTQYLAGATAAVELYLVDGMGHAIATGSDPAGTCPSTSGAFFADAKICATLRAAQFFGVTAADGTGSGSGSGSGSDDGSAEPDSGGCAVGQPGWAMLILLAVVGARRRRGP